MEEHEEQERWKRILRMLILAVILTVGLGSSMQTLAADTGKVETEQLSASDGGGDEAAGENSSSHESAGDDDTKTVRVAYVLMDNFQEGADGERKYGYGYEYLQRISYYTGWHYEYVYGNYKECLERLISGDVDLMGGISYTPERAEQIYYSEEEQGIRNFYIFGLEGQTKLSGEDLSTFNGTKIGLIAGGYSAELAGNWCEEHEIDCELIEYEETEAWITDMSQGVIDAVILPEVYVQESWAPLLEISEESYYFGVTKERPDLLEELDQAMKMIREANPFYNEDLRAKYITDMPIASKALTETEKTWLGEHQQIRIGYLSDYMPYCGTDEKTGEAEGMLVDLMDNISSLYSMSYELDAYDTYETMWEAFLNGEVEAIFPVYGDYSFGEKRNVMVSDTVTRSTMTVFNSGEEETVPAKIAITCSDPFQEKYAEIYYPDAEWVICDSIMDCIDAVADRTADFTVVETAKVNESGKYKWWVQQAGLQEFINISFAVQWGETELFTILNKGLLATDDSLIENSLIYHSQKNVHYTVMDFLREHIIATILSAVAASLLIAGFLVFYFVSMARKKNEISQANRQISSMRWDTTHDTLTKLLNRASFLELSGQLRESRTPMALLIIDVDKFKKVNDTYGHAMGDRALVKVGALLGQCFRPNDSVIRYAGDEFVVLMVGILPKESDVIASRITKLNEILQHPDDDVPKLSLSVGIAFSSGGYSDELFARADAALYETKANGRCGYTIAGSENDK